MKMFIKQFSLCFSLFYLLIVLLVNQSVSENINITTLKEPPTDGRFGVYHSLEDTMATLNRPEFKEDSKVQNLLQVYEEKCVPPIPKGRKTPIRRPFVVVESNHKKGKKVFGKMLADSLTGTLKAFPPKCLEEFANEFHYSTVLRRAYISLCNYAMAHIVRVVYYMQPVIVTGYWLHQAALYYAKEFTMENLPQVGSPLLRWPHDLLEPDMLFYINVTNIDLKKGEKPLPTRPKVVQVFRQMRNPNVIIINQRNDIKEIALVTEVYMAGVADRMKMTHRHIKF